MIRINGKALLRAIKSIIGLIIWVVLAGLIGTIVNFMSHYSVKITFGCAVALTIIVLIIYFYDEY